MFCRTSCLRSTPVTWLHWSFWTCLPLSTPMTTQFCSDALKHLGSEEPLYTGSSRTWSANNSMFVLQQRLHIRPSSSAVYHRALFLARSSFATRRRSTVVDWRLWFSSSSLCRRHSDLRVLLTNAVLVDETTEPYFIFLSVSTLLPAGCDHTGTSSTLPKRKSSG